MSRGLLFWIIMLLILILTLYSGWPSGTGYGARAYLPLGTNLLEFLLFALLGWDVYGAALRGKKG